MKRHVFSLRLFSLAVLASALCFVPLRAIAQTPSGATPSKTTLRLQADRIMFYYDRFLVEADGNVRIQTNHGVSMAGDSFSMDLRLNRFLLAGHVKLQSKQGSLSGAAISDFLDFSRVYFIPVTVAPDRWTYLNDDYEHPAKGRIMPGDVFSFPDLSRTRPSLSAHSAVIASRQFVRFSDHVTYFAGVHFPLPSFYVNFSANSNLAVNTLSGANLDETWNATGTANSISAIHVRYDSVNHTYLSFEQHLASDRAYVVASLNPATTSVKWWNLQGSEMIGSRFQFRLFTQLYTNQSNLSLPHAAAITNYVFATQAFPHSYVQAIANLTNYDLVGPSSYNDPNYPLPAALNHPAQVQLTWSSFANRVGKLPIREQTHIGYGFNHDSYTQGYEPGLQTYGGYTYTTIYNTAAEIALSTFPIKIGDHDNPYKTLSFNAVFDKSNIWYTVPHNVRTTTTTASLSRQFSRALSSYLSYQIVNTGDYYNRGGYASYPLPGDPGFAAFQGVSTQRTLALDFTAVTSPEFNANLVVRKHTDFPTLPPGFVALPPLNNIGQFINGGNFLGGPSYDISAEVRARLMPHVTLDISRAYYFNYGTLRWSPEFVVQVLP